MRSLLLENYKSQQISTAIAFYSSLDSSQDSTFIFTARYFIYIQWPCGSAWIRNVLHNLQRIKIKLGFVLQRHRFGHMTCRYCTYFPNTFVVETTQSVNQPFAFVWTFDSLCWPMFGTTCTICGVNIPITHEMSIKCARLSTNLRECRCLVSPISINKKAKEPESLLMFKYRMRKDNKEKKNAVQKKEKTPPKRPLRRRAALMAGDKCDSSKCEH